MVSDVDRPKNNSPRDRRISEDQMQRICDALTYEDDEPIDSQRREIAVACLFAIETAMRQGEIWSLDWKHVYVAEKFVHWPETKNGQKRNVALSKRAVELLTKMDIKDQGRVFS